MNQHSFSMVELVITPSNMKLDACTYTSELNHVDDYRYPKNKGGVYRT